MVYRVKACNILASSYGYTHALFIDMMSIFCFDKFAYTHF